MKTHLNTLYITLEGAYLRKDGAAVVIKHEGEVKLRVPLHNLEGIVCFGWDITISTHLMHACAEADVSLSFHNPHGKFLSSSIGPQSGNILLRREQYRRADDEADALAIAKNSISAKLANSRLVLLRASRDHGERFPDRAAELRAASAVIANRLKNLTKVTSLEQLRGVEGDCAATYFSVFSHLITVDGFTFEGRSKRPPLDPVNALLSFLYVLLAHECRSACESVGLDPQCGFLHRDRPGRASLALDLMEEFRPHLADRLALSLMNRSQLTLDDFEIRENNATVLKEDSRKKVLNAWQERKQDIITHPFLDEKMTLGLLPHIQARLLARYLRGDYDAYPSYLWT